jgi:transposase-like protein
VERKKGQQYSNEFRRQAVEEMRGCDNIVRLARELGICRRVPYNWRNRLDQTNPQPARSREMILCKQILGLKRLLANKTLEVDFFRHALQRVGARRRQKANSGDTASTMR